MTSPPVRLAHASAETDAFRLFVEAVKDYAIFMLDPNGHVTTWNAGAARIKGYTADEIIGRHFSSFYTQADRERGHPQRELEIAVSTGRYEEEGERVRKDGTRFWAHVVITAIFDRQRRLLGFGKVTRDITERKLAEDAQRLLNEELERRVEERTRQLAEVNQELESFCYSVSHDLRAPLRGMQGFADALREDYAGKLDEQANEYLARIKRASGRMESLIEDLLDYSRLSRADLPGAPVELDGVVVQSQAQLAADIAARGASIEVARGLPRVIGHHGTLVRIVANLLGNAIKFVPAQRRAEVRVRAERRGQHVRLWVEDNGIGIEPEHTERIFRVFERLHGMETYPGTGIGLAVVRKGMERMHGSCGVESSLGAGSRFWIELPHAAGE